MLPDPSTEHTLLLQVYLQVAQPGGSQDWNTRFSGMMFKVLQDAYVNSPVYSANQDQNVALMGRRLGPQPSPPRVWSQPIACHMCICLPQALPMAVSMDLQTAWSLCHVPVKRSMPR